MMLELAYLVVGPVEGRGRLRAGCSRRKALFELPKIQSALVLAFARQMWRPVRGVVMTVFGMADSTRRVVLPT